MVDLPAIASAITALKGMKDIAEAMIGLRDAKALQEKRLEFQARIIDAQNSVLAIQEERASLLERVGQLEKDLADMKAWDTEKQRYQLEAINSRFFVYAMKPDATGSEPPHWLCSTCYQKSKKSILSVKSRSVVTHNNIWECPACGTKNELHWDASPTRPAG